jgi:hypothetical protein
MGGVAVGELTEAEAIDIMRGMVAHLDGVPAADAAHVLATIASAVIIEAQDPAGALDDFYSMLRRQIASAAVS